MDKVGGIIVGDECWERGVNLEVPSPARVYDYFLGGSHNVAVDRELARRLAQVLPSIGDIMRANRAFLRRAVEFLADAGIRQFLDLGSGVPTVGNVHEIAQRRAPGARVVYVDIDPVAVAMSERILNGNPDATVIEADLLDPTDVLTRPATRQLLDFTRPLAVLLVGVMHQLPGERPVRAIRHYRQAVVPGSFLALTAATADRRPEDTARAYKHTYDQGYGPGTDLTFRSRAETAALLDGYQLVEPGVVPLADWRPDPTEPPKPGVVYSYGAVGRLG